ncbi:hypothetical protein HDU97_003419 [Phlyctochytrium planicorne]|nr:hypothetical protein HDU97_003419 [Phlyctochytrium planicorne]
MVDRNKSRREKDHIIPLEEHLGLQEMKRVTNSLHKWVTEVLDSPVLLNATGGPNESLAVPEQDGPNRPASQQISAFGGAPSNYPAPPIDTNVVANGDFGILLNAWKPSILETKPPTRLHVVQELNPPESLVHSLKENLGADVDEAILDKTRYRATKFFGNGRKFHDIWFDSTIDIAHHPKHSKDFQSYGAWYVEPKKWNHLMIENRAAKSKASSQKDRHMVGLVQRKLDEIVAQRAKTDINLQLSTSGAPATAPQTAGLTQPNTAGNKESSHQISTPLIQLVDSAGPSRPGEYAEEEDGGGGEREAEVDGNGDVEGNQVVE